MAQALQVSSSDLRAFQHVPPGRFNFHCVPMIYPDRREVDRRPRYNTLCDQRPELPARKELVRRGPRCQQLFHALWLILTISIFTYLYPAKVSECRYVKYTLHEPYSAIRGVFCSFLRTHDKSYDAHLQQSFGSHKSFI